MPPKVFGQGSPSGLGAIVLIIKILFLFISHFAKRKVDRRIYKLFTLNMNISTQVLYCISTIFRNFTKTIYKIIIIIMYVFNQIFIEIIIKLEFSIQPLRLSQETNPRKRFTCQPFESLSTPPGVE